MSGRRFRRMAVLALFEAVLVAVTIGWGLVGLGMALVPVQLIARLTAKRRARQPRRAGSHATKQSKSERVPGFVPPEVESAFWDTQPAPAVDWVSAEPDEAGSARSYG